MTGDRFQVTVRRPVADLEAEVRTEFHLARHALASVSIEDGAVVFVFGSRSPNGVAPPLGSTPQETPSRGRRRRGQRRRTKTRGWKPIATVVNSLGQRVRVYDVFLKALKDQKLNRAEQRKAVEKLIRANGNSPSRDQVDYFLGNTLEYLRSGASREEPS